MQFCTNLIFQHDTDGGSNRGGGDGGSGAGSSFELRTVCKDTAYARWAAGGWV